MNSASEHVYANAFAVLSKKQMFQDDFLKSDFITWMNVPMGWPDLALSHQSLLGISRQKRINDLLYWLINWYIHLTSIPRFCWSATLKKPDPVVVEPTTSSMLFFRINTNYRWQKSLIYSSSLDPDRTWIRNEIKSYRIQNQWNPWKPMHSRKTIIYEPLKRLSIKTLKKLVCARETGLQGTYHRGR